MISSSVGLLLALFGVFSGTNGALTGNAPGTLPLNKCGNKNYCEYGSWVSGSDLGEHLTVWAPEGADTYPVIYFVSGFGGLVPVDLYEELLEPIAAAGYIIIGIDKVRVPNYVDHSSSVSNLIEWSEIYLGDLLTKINVPARPDMSRIFLGGQSAGCHTVTQALKMYGGACKSNVKGLFLIDPVDGSDPFGLNDKTDVIDAEHNGESYTKISKLNFEVPTYYIAAGLDDKPTLGGIGPACAPAALSLDRFWYSANGPIWGFNATKMGHMDCLDSPVAGIPLCPSDASGTQGERKVDFHRLMQAKIVDFLNGNTYDGEDRSHMIQSLEDLNSHRQFLNDVTIYKDTNGKDVSLPNQGCKVLGVPDNCQTRLDGGYPSACRMETRLLRRCKRGEYEFTPCTDTGLLGIRRKEMCCPNGYQLPTLAGLQLANEDVEQYTIEIVVIGATVAFVAVASIGAAIVVRRKNKRRTQAAAKDLEEAEKQLDRESVSNPMFNSEI